MKRTPEPELMDDEAQARAYAQADFDEPNALFLELYANRFGAEPQEGYVLDLGCGPGDITVRFARAHPRSMVHGLDGSEAMLSHARDCVSLAEDVRDRVQFVRGTLPGESLPHSRYDAVISNSLLHHLHEPSVLWQVVRRHAAPGARVLIMDLMRPPSEAAAHALVEEYAAAEPAVLKEDFYNSLLAAFEPGEIRAQLAEAGLAGLAVEPVSDRHLIVAGTFE